MYEGTEREHTCDRLTPGHTYRVKVAACSAGGRSEVSYATIYLFCGELIYDKWTFPLLSVEQVHFHF